MKNKLSIFFLSIGLALCLSGCSREVLVTQGKSLGTREVYPAAGDFSVFIKTDGVWSVSSPEKWIHVPEDLFKDASALIVRYDSNESDFITFKPVRKGAIVIQSLGTMVADTLWVLQQGIPDGKEYESLPQNSYIEFPEGQIETLRILYANVKGASASAIASWTASVGADVNCLIADDGLSITLKDGTSADEIGTLASPSALFAKARGLSLALADFGEGLDDDAYYNAVVDLLSASYDQPDAEENWLVGGSFYYLSVMEAGYAATPSWYPANPAAAEFAADRYVQSSNLTDCVWMTRRDFTPTWTESGKSWRADYLYASHSVWNAVTLVRVLENVPAGASHKALEIKIKF